MCGDWGEAFHVCRWIILWQSQADFISSLLRPQLRLQSAAGCTANKLVFTISVSQFVYNHAQKCWISRSKCTKKNNKATGLYMDSLGSFQRSCRPAHLDLEEQTPELGRRRERVQGSREGGREGGKGGNWWGRGEWKERAGKQDNGPQHLLPNSKVRLSLTVRT